MIKPSAKAYKGGVLFDVHVTPSAKEDSISCVDGVLRVRTREPPDKGKANRALLKLLKHVFGGSQIVSGHTSKKKSVYAENVCLDDFYKLLGGLAGAESV